MTPAESVAWMLRMYWDLSSLSKGATVLNTPLIALISKIPSSLPIKRAIRLAQWKGHCLPVTMLNLVPLTPLRPLSQSCTVKVCTTLLTAASSGTVIALAGATNSGGQSLKSITLKKTSADPIIKIVKNISTHRYTVRIDLRVEWVGPCQ